MIYGKTFSKIIKVNLLTNNFWIDWRFVMRRILKSLFNTMSIGLINSELLSFDFFIALFLSIIPLFFLNKLMNV